MDFRLLLDLEALEFLQALPRRRRQKILAHLRLIQDFPGQFSDYLDHDAVGRRVDVSVFNGVAIYFWTDSADRHIKILKIIEAD